MELSSYDLFRPCPDSFRKDLHKECPTCGGTQEVLSNTGHLILDVIIWDLKQKPVVSQLQKLITKTVAEY